MFNNCLGDYYRKQTKETEYRVSQLRLSLTPWFSIRDLKEDAVKSRHEKDSGKKTLLCSIPLAMLKRIPENNKSGKCSGNNDIPDSAKLDPEALALRRILREIHGKNIPTTSDSLREGVLTKNFVKRVKTSNVSSSNYCSSVPTNVNKTVNKEDCENYGEKPLERKTSSNGPAAPKKARRDESSNNVPKLNSVQFVAEVENLRKIIHSCFSDLQILQQEVQMKLMKYDSYSGSNCMTENKLNLESRERKIDIQDDSDDKSSGDEENSSDEDNCSEEDDSDNEVDSCRENSDEENDSDAEDCNEDICNSMWSCSIDGLKIKFSKIKEEDLR